MTASMSPAQRKTVRGLVIFAGVGFASLLWLLYVELTAVGNTGATISELVWVVWAHQPWVVFIVSHTIAAPFWFVMGHFLAAPKDTYSRIRNGG